MLPALSAPYSMGSATVASYRRKSTMSQKGVAAEKPQRHEHATANVLLAQHMCRGGSTCANSTRAVAPAHVPWLQHMCCLHMRMLIMLLRNHLPCQQVHHLSISLVPA